MAKTTQEPVATDCSDLIEFDMDELADAGCTVKTARFVTTGRDSGSRPSEWVLDLVLDQDGGHARDLKVEVTAYDDVDAIMAQWSHKDLDFEHFATHSTSRNGCRLHLHDGSLRDDTRPPAVIRVSVALGAEQPTLGVDLPTRFEATDEGVSLMRCVAWLSPERRAVWVRGTVGHVVRAQDAAAMSELERAIAELETLQKPVPAGLAVEVFALGPAGELLASGTVDVGPAPTSPQAWWLTLPYPEWPASPGVDEPALRPSVVVAKLRAPELAADH